MAVRISFIVLLAFAGAAPLHAAEPARPITNRTEWVSAVSSQFARHKPDANSVRGVSGKARTTLNIEVRRDGSLAGLNVDVPSGSDAADSAALQMVKDAGTLPPLPPDMTGESQNLSLPVSFDLSSNDISGNRLYVHTLLGVRVEVREPFAVIAAPNRPEFALGLQVVATGEPPLYAAPNEPICLIGFQPGEKSDTPLQGDDQVTTELTEQLIRKHSEDMGLITDGSAISNYRGTRLIELFQTPKAGADWPDLKFYAASFDWRNGGYLVTCMAKRDKFDSALADFRAIRDGAGLLDAAREIAK